VANVVVLGLRSSLCKRGNNQTLSSFSRNCWLFKARVLPCTTATTGTSLRTGSATQ